MITNEVAFIAIAVSDKERARKFYQETLELKPGQAAMEGARVEYDLGATTIGVGCHPAWKPSRDGTTVAFEVEDIDATIAKLKERGVSFDIEKTETPVCWKLVHSCARRMIGCDTRPASMLKAINSPTESCPPMTN